MEKNKKIKILLIEPPSPNEFGTLRILGSLGSHKADMAWAPLDLMIISGYLDKNNIKSKIVDANTLKYPFHKIKQIVSEEKPEAVIFTITVPTLDNDVTTAKVTKEFSQNIITAAISLSIKSAQANLLEKYPYLDAVVYSEPEIPILNMIKANYDFSSVQGLQYRTNGTIKENSPSPQCMNLDEFGIPSHDKVPFKLYRDPVMKRHPMTLVNASRGCKNACIHCLSIFQKPLRYRSVENVLEELNLIKKLGIREIKFFDCGLTNDLNWTNKFFQQLIEKKFNFSWNCNARADCLPIETLKLMKSAGCHTIFIGSESADPAILKLMEKNESVEEIEDAIKRIKKAGICAAAYFTFGLLGETKDTMKKSIEFAKRVEPDLVTFGIVVPVWGTRFYEALAENNYITNFNAGSYDPNNPPPYSYPHLSSQEIYDMSRQGYREFYLRPKFIIKRFLSEPFNIKKHLNNFKVFVKRYL